MSWLYSIWYAFKFRHRWNYRTPYTRTCKRCGRTEDLYCHSWDAFKVSFVGWWEQMYPLPHTPDACIQQQDLE